MATKTYVLLAHTKPTANVYIHPNNGQKVRIENRPLDHAYLKLTYQDREGLNKTIRLKMGCDDIDQQKQIKEFLIPANEPFTQAERDAVRFHDGILKTDNITVQTFLETSPQFDGFWKPNEKGKVGVCSSINGPLYTLLDKSVELNEDFEMFQLKLKAANKIDSLNLKEAQEMQIRLNGSYFTPPDDEKECKLGLLAFAEETNKAGLEAILKEDINQDEEVTILLGKAINLNILSFDKVENQVVRIKGNKVTELKEIPSSYDPEERKRYFSVFLTSPEGRLLLEDIKKDVAAAEKKDKKAA